MKLTDVKRILRETTIDNQRKNPDAEVLTPVQEYQVFYNVCCNLVKEGTITRAQFLRWTKVY